VIAGPYNFFQKLNERMSMTARKKTMGAIFFCILAVGCVSAQTTYYVDSNSGNDNNTGKLPEKAWATLEKLNGVIFKPGDRILLKAGTIYKGVFAPRGSGTSVAPIIVDQYGAGSKPRIDGEGKNAAVVLRDIEYWEVNNLEITNTGATREGRRTGVAVMAENVGDRHHLYLRDLVIHDVNGSLVKNHGGGSGIYWRNSGERVKTRFIDLRIERCHIYKCERNAIISDGYARRDRWYPSLGVVIRGNLLEQIPGDGIVPIGCDGALIEHNVMRDSPDILSHEESAAGIWPWSSDNTLIQYNEVSGHKAKWDGQGFDADWNCKNTIIQYNYSHDNAGGFLLVCNNGGNINTIYNSGTEGTIVRYNVSVNDGLRHYPTERKGFFSPVIHITGPCKDTQLYNNIIYVPAKPDAKIDNTMLVMDNWGGPWPVNTVFTNNIFYSYDPSRFVFGKDTNTAFLNNVFHGSFKELPRDEQAILQDPLFVSPPVKAQGFEALAGFKLMKDSPCINSGRAVDAENLLDFFGSRVDTQAIDRGIHESN
jgi:hypothetical protein